MDPTHASRLELLPRNQIRHLLLQALVLLHVLCQDLELELIRLRGVEFYLRLFLRFLRLQLRHGRMTVHNIDGLVDVLNQFLQSLLSNQNPVGLEQAQDIQAVSVVPQDPREVTLGSGKVLVVVPTRYHAEQSSLVADVLPKDRIHKLGLAIGDSLRVDDLDLSLGQLSGEECLESVDFDFGVEGVGEDSRFGTVGLASFPEVGGPLVTHPGNSLSLLGSHLLSRTNSRRSVSRRLSSESVELDPEIVQPVDQIPPQRLVEDILRQFYFTLSVPIDLLR